MAGMAELEIILCLIKRNSKKRDLISEDIKDINT
jgi:hypothetical protein